MGPHPLGLESSAAKPCPGSENWRLAQAAGTGRKAAAPRCIEGVWSSRAGQGQSRRVKHRVPSPGVLTSRFVLMRVSSVLLLTHLFLLLPPLSLHRFFLTWCTGKFVGGNIRQAWIEILLPPPTGCVILGKSLSLPEPVSSSAKYSSPGLA